MTARHKAHNAAVASFWTAAWATAAIAALSWFVILPSIGLLWVSGGLR